MDRLGGVQEADAEAQALHAGLKLAPDEATLSDAANNQLAAGLVGRGYVIESAQERVLGAGIGLVQAGCERQRRCFS